MGVCDSINNNKNNKQNNNNNNIKNIENDIKNNIENNNNNINKLRLKFNLFLEKNPFFNYEIQTQKNLINEFISKNFLSPFEFIKNKNLININNNNYNNLFLLLFEICFLKCEPILANITDDKKKANLIFFRIVIFMLSNLIDMERKIDLIKTIIVESYDPDQKKHNIDDLKQEILSLSEVCSEILIYFGMLPQFISNNELIKVLTEQNYLLDNKYPKVDLDVFFFDKIQSLIKNKNDNEMVKQKWFDFIIEPLMNENENDNDNANNLNLENIGLNTMMRKQILMYYDIDDNTKEEIIYRIVHMLDSNNFMETFFGKNVPEYDICFYKSDLN
jgi:hypothetical protein